MLNNMSKGYIAITTTIIVSLVVLLLSSAVGSSSLFSRLNELDSMYKRSSYFLTRSCLDHAMYKLAQSTSYGGSETVVIGSDTCTLLPVETNGGNKIIKAWSQTNSTRTNLKLTIVTLDLSTVSLEEVQSF